MLIAIIMALTYRTFIYYLRMTTEIDYFMWDLKTVTAGDFTARLEISDEMWDYQVDYLKKNPFKSEHFKEVIKEAIVEQLSKKEPAEGFDNGKKNFKPKVEIACIQFAFDNSELIFLLKDRGKYVRQYDIEKVKKLDRDIE